MIFCTFHDCMICKDAHNMYEKKRISSRIFYLRDVEIFMIIRYTLTAWHR